MYKVVIFIPETHKEVVKTAMFSAGAGRYENYDCCSWESTGIGQFRPLEGSNPFVGFEGDIEQVREFRVEMICQEKYLDAVIVALREAHPYEEPAFEYWKVEIA